MKNDYKICVFLNFDYACTASIDIRDSQISQNATRDDLVSLVLWAQANHPSPVSSPGKSANMQTSIEEL